MLFVAASMLGYISWKHLKMEIFPNAELPMLFIQVNSMIESTPEYMEQKAVIPVESAIASLENIELEETLERIGKPFHVITVHGYEVAFLIKYARQGAPTTAGIPTPAELLGEHLVLIRLK